MKEGRTMEHRKLNYPVSVRKQKGAEGAQTICGTADGELRLIPGSYVIFDMGAGSVGGYPFFFVKSYKGKPTLRISYSDRMIPYEREETIGLGDFTRGSCTYLGVELPVMPANPYRFEDYTIARDGLFVYPLIQGQERFVWQVLFPIMEEFAAQGFDVPKIMFYTNTESEQRVTQLYSQLYEKGLYKDLWFCPNGKPLIICANKAGCSEEIRNFFDFRSSQWPGTPDKEDGFPWIDFNRSQKVYPKGGVTGGTIMSVSVSQHPGWPFSDSIQYKDVTAASGGTYYNENWGRGYTSEAGVNDPSKIDEGANFQEQWNNALREDPSTVFVTGWNEWIAVKFYEDITVTTGVPSRLNLPDRRVFFVDTINEEFSRDIEPMKGGYGDNYYLQMIQNIRAYKGTGEGETVSGQKLTIDVNGSVKQWESVQTSFRDFVGDAVVRNYVDAAGINTYTDNSARNDISEIRLAYDAENLYIMVSTAENITAYEEGDLTWMNVMLGVEGATGEAFEGFQYVINRSPDGEKTSVEKCVGGYSFETIGQADYSVNGKYLQIAIPKTLLGLNDSFTLKVKVTDHIMHPEDIMDYYVSGDSAPIGRLSYKWKV